jgi:hypothetical protein
MILWIVARLVTCRAGMSWIRCETKQQPAREKDKHGHSNHGQYPLL